jgi:hypothetical protein
MFACMHLLVDSNNTPKHTPMDWQPEIDELVELRGTYLESKYIAECLPSGSREFLIVRQVDKIFDLMRMYNEKYNEMLNERDLTLMPMWGRHLKYYNHLMTTELQQLDEIRVYGREVTRGQPYNPETGYPY